MEHTNRIVTRHMNRRMDGKTCGIHPRTIGVVNHGTGFIDGYQIGRSDFVKPQAERIKQKALLTPGSGWEPCGNMGVDAVIHALERDQPIGRSQIAADFGYRLITHSIAH